MSWSPSLFYSRLSIFIRHSLVALLPRPVNNFTQLFSFLYNSKIKTIIMPSPMKKIFKSDDTNALAFAKLTEHAFPPTKGSALAAGFDLKSAYSYVVKAHDKELIKTDIQIKVPHGTYGRVAPRSGLAWKNFIDVGAGVIDEDYRGNVGIILFNHSNEDFIVNPGDRVAQLICEKIEYPELVERETLDETDRGEGGFGSTGTN